MLGIVDKIRNMFRGEEQNPPDVERLRVEFRDRYHSFKLLLSANNKALEVMTDMERALGGTRPFGMAFVRSCCTSVSVNVFSMIQHLERLAPNRYAALRDRFDEIQARVDASLLLTKPATDDRLVIPLSSVDRHMADVVGSKMANLGEIGKSVAARTPAGFSITARAWQRFLEHNDLQAEIDRRIQSLDPGDMETLHNLSAALQQLIIRAEVPRDLADAVSGAWEALEASEGRTVTVALRSSAIGEDLAGSSFAGQYRSELNVSRENVLQAYKEILASKYTLQAITYRMNKGFRDEEIAMCVGCMVMVDARAGGVVYTCNPVNPRDRDVYINATLGLPKSVVDGSTACDLFVVTRDAPMTVAREEIQPKTHKFVCYPEEGVCRLDLAGDSGARPALDEAEALHLAREALRIESFYGRPQDIEWALDGQGTLFVLQCRPMTRSGRPGVPREGGGGRTDEKSVILSGGITASPGAACGRVYLVDKAYDLLGFPAGAVLVARQALPRWASLLDRAAAVVTEKGGFAGHLANVAREFGVPALFGVEDAATRLVGGERVTVDASGLAVHRGRVEALLTTGEKEVNLMKGSTVYQTLEETARHIVPLHLLDPDAPDFRPEKCRTFHDITRFVHEKSVHEMFRFGKEHHFSERSSKQLHHHVPMQWWLLNLDDGFREEVPGKYVRLDNIASLPMLAFWEGFAAVPWEGPPIDGKGLMSVMFRSTANPALTPGVRSRYADRNYFLVSRNYCSLSSRLGYHFSTLEALISERDRENYVSFQFKGGAADDRRRLKRVAFIGDILRENGFRVEIREDNLLARVEARDRDYMLARVRILGYLSLHTRQLDMIMDNGARVRYYRQKIDGDLKAVTAGSFDR